MQDNQGLLFTVGMIALLFLMDALKRRRQQRRRNEVDEPESRQVREPAAGGAEPSDPVAWEAESDWAYLRRFPEASESAGAEEGAPEPDVAEGPRARRLPQPDGSVVVAPRAPGDESVPITAGASQSHGGGRSTYVRLRGDRERANIDAGQTTQTKDHDPVDGEDGQGVVKHRRTDRDDVCDNRTRAVAGQEQQDQVIAKQCAAR